MSNVIVSNISKTYHTELVSVKALTDLSLNLPEGSFVSIAGPSGSGKTTLLNLIGCIDSPDKGKIILNDTEVTILPESQLAMFRNEYIGFIFQDFNLIPVLNVYENVQFALSIHPKLKNNHKELIMNVLKNVGIPELKNRFPQELSGGQKQRVAIARAIVKHPVIVLADEPTANLDSANARNIMEIMRKMNEEFKTTFIFSTHDTLVMDYARRLIKLRDGTVIEDIRK